MLKELKIKNLILVEEATIDLQAGLNVISGETGSGKSALMEALSLVLGERCDSGVIRHECDKASIEACFEVSSESKVYNLLSEAGIEYEWNEDLFFKREIYNNGKSRLWINQQAANLNLVRKLRDHLIQFVGQHANRQLLEISNHRYFLDVYGELLEQVADFEESWKRKNQLQTQLDQLVNQEAYRKVEMGRLREIIEELNQASIKEGEEEDLYSEYSKLTRHEELLELGMQVCSALTDEDQSILNALSRQKPSFEKLKNFDPIQLPEIANHFHQIVRDLQDLSFQLQKYLNNLEHSPSRLQQISERMTTITKLCKKYQIKNNQINEFKSEIEKRLEQLENSECQIEELKVKLKEAENKNDLLAQELSQKRKAAAQVLSNDLEGQLRDLNMPRVKFHISIIPHNRCATGDDSVEFYIAPNYGENLIGVKDCASGGELSRIMLSLMVLLAQKNQMPILIFDEIDANIGGSTALVVGEKLRIISENHQVICFTHFPQVALQARHHIQISKREAKNRTITLAKTLNAKERKEELARMRGE